MPSCQGTMEEAWEAQARHHQAATEILPSKRAEQGGSNQDPQLQQQASVGYPDCTIAQGLQEVVSKPVPQVCGKLATSIDTEGRWQWCTQGVEKRIPFPFWHDLLFLIVVLKVSVAVLAFLARRNLLAVLVLSPDILPLLFKVSLIDALRILRPQPRQRRPDWRQDDFEEAYHLTFDLAIRSRSQTSSRKGSRLYVPGSCHQARSKGNFPSSTSIGQPQPRDSLLRAKRHALRTIIAQSTATQDRIGFLARFSPAFVERAALSVLLTTPAGCCLSLLLRSARLQA